MKVFVLSLAFLALASATSFKSQFEAFEHEFGYKNAPKPGTVYADIKDIKVSDLPASVDWRDKGAISAVKDQGYCGSCWAFATAETIESYLQINSGNSAVEELSAQHITSCTPNELSCGGTGGCQGSIPQL